MPAASRLGDKAQIASDAHGCPACPHPGVGPVVSASPNVNINGLPAARQDDPGIHAACCGSNTFKIKAGSPSVYVNGKPMARLNDATKHCGGDGDIIDGSPDVFADDGGGGAGTLAALAARALAIARAAAAALAAGQAQQHSDTHDSGEAGGGGGGGGDLASDGVAAGMSGGSAGGSGAAGGAHPGSDPFNTSADKPPGGQPTSGAANEPQPGPLPPGQLQVTVVAADGSRQKDLDYQLTLPDGKQRTGKTSAQGDFKYQDLPSSGECKFELPGLQLGEAGKPSKAGRLRIGKDGVQVKIGAAGVVELPARRRRARMTGLLFETDKTFLRPLAMDRVRLLRRFIESHQGSNILVSGHTDKVGQPDYNRGLSMERAQSIKAFLLDDADGWMKWYQGMPCSARWGVREDQYMLSAVADKEGKAFYAGAINGALDAPTRDAVKRFQRERMLPETGNPDWNTRKELVRAYMALEGTSLKPGTRMEPHGCGYWHPAVDQPGDVEANRRVEVYLFEGAIDPPPRKICPWNGCPEYPEWSKQPLDTIDLDQPGGELLVTVESKGGAPLDDATVTIAGPIGDTGITGKDKSLGKGQVGFRELPPGSYTITAHHQGFKVGSSTAQVEAGSKLSGGDSPKLASADKSFAAAGDGKEGDGTVVELQPESTDVGLIRITGDEGQLVDALGIEGLAISDHGQRILDDGKFSVSAAANDAAIAELQQRGLTVEVVISGADMTKHLQEVLGQGPVVA